jgi:nicotinate dehydrogenase subunit A
MDCSDGQMLKDSCQAGAGIARRNKWKVQQEVLVRQLVQVLQEFAAPPNGIYSVFAQRKYMPPRVKLWIDFLHSRQLHPSGLLKLKRKPMQLHINGVQQHVNYPTHLQAVYALRNDLKLKGVRLGCGEGQCGACTILVDGVAMTSCNLPFGALEGKHVTTLEGLGTPEKPHPVQAAMLRAQPGQCGFCHSGLVVRAAALVDAGKPLTESEVGHALDPHLCRCGSHPRVIQAVLAALEMQGAA